jgi:hypothetical protein
MTTCCQIYYVDRKPFPLVTIETTQYCYVRAIENILFNPSGRSTGAFASVMRKLDLKPWVVPLDCGFLMEDMQRLLEGEAKGRARRCSILFIDDCIKTLEIITNDKTQPIRDFLTATDKAAYVERPSVESSVRNRPKIIRYFADCTLPNSAKSKPSRFTKSHKKQRYGR